MILDKEVIIFYSKIFGILVVDLCSVGVKYCMIGYMWFDVVFIYF